MQEALKKEDSRSGLAELIAYAIQECDSDSLQQAIDALNSDALDRPERLSIIMGQFLDLLNMKDGPSEESQNRFHQFVSKVYDTIFFNRHEIFPCKVFFVLNGPVLGFSFRFAKDVIAALGYSVELVWTDGGSEALFDRLQKSRPHVIVVGQFGSEESNEALEELLQHIPEATSETKLLFVSSLQAPGSESFDMVRLVDSLQSFALAPQSYELPNFDLREGSTGRVRRDKQALDNHLVANLIEETKALKLANSYQQKVLLDVNHRMGAIAHDLRNPLFTLQGYTEMLQEADLSEDRKKSCFEKISRASGFMLKLIKRSVFFNELATNTSEIHKEANRLKPILVEAVRGLESYAQSREVSIDMQEVSDAEVFVDSEKIKVVFEQIIHNAIRFSDPGNSVNVLSEASAGYVCIRVEDRGIGIPIDEYGKMFRSYAKTMAKYQGERGTGLGLSSAEKIVSFHNGKITFESKVGKGSEFQIFLPYLKTS